MNNFNFRLLLYGDTKTEDQSQFGTIERTSPQIQKIPFLQENKKSIIQFILTVLFLGLGIWFIRHQKAELIECT
jgi:hypothetical protein